MRAPLVLVLTNSEDVTASYLCERMLHRGIGHVRLDTDRIIGRGTIEVHASARLAINEIVVEPASVTGLWYRRPLPIPIPGDWANKSLGAHAVAEWSSALEGFLELVPTSRWVNHPANNARASNKIEQLARAKAFGLDVPATLITTDASSARNFVRQLNGSVIVKPLSGGTIQLSHDTEGQIFTSAIGPEHLALIDDIENCPTMLQARISKVADVRVTCVDHQVIAVEMKRSDDRVDVRYGDMAGVTYRIVTIPPTVATRLDSLLSSYNLRFAAVDFVVDTHGAWQFLEINPNGQWAWLDEDAQTDIASLVVGALVGEVQNESA